MAAPRNPATAPDLRRLSMVVLVSGTGALCVEICASRLLAPFFGNSTIVWANIIGLILIYLSAGYWIGGRVADKHPSSIVLGRILAVAAVCVAVLPFASHPVLHTALDAFTSVSVGTVVASFFSTLLLFSAPVTLLGMVSPFAIRLAVTDIQTAGTISGRLYALSTLGSIAGTFLPALLTIPLIGTQRTMICAAVLLGISAVMVRGVRLAPLPIAIAALVLIPPAAIKEQPGLLVQTESAYQYVSVAQQHSGERDLQLNEGVAIHSVWRPNSVLTGGEWDMFLVPPALRQSPVRSILIIGNAGGTTAREFGRYYPDPTIDGVEIDPVVTDIGQRYLGLNDNPNLTVHTADGRAFLSEARRQYDMIIVDAYRQPYIPFQLATQEFFQLCREHLTENGILALNVERIPDDPALSRTIESTVASVMPDSWSWPALKFNELVVATKRTVPQRPRVSTPMNPAISVLGDLFTSQLVRADRSQTPMTDDHSAIEWITDRSLLKYIAGGGALVEPPLPVG